ncbi:MAG: hypothetical protein ACYCTF_02925 [Acidiferrobacter sp.]
MLDPGNLPISFVDVPGVMHLPIKNPNNKPFVLLHAKVAVLGFAHESDIGRWQLRLIISTGNWTRVTLEDSLDLVWRIDLQDEELNGLNDSVRQRCADVSASWRLIEWLREYFDTRILRAVPPKHEGTESIRNMDLVESWIQKAVQKKGSAKARVFDNRKTSLLAQLPALIAATGVVSRRNYIAMGSGFYETAPDQDGMPSVLAEVMDVLRNEENDFVVLTESPEMDVFVNPAACQVIANSREALSAAGFVVRPAAIPSFFPEKTPPFLHAKFIFSAHQRQDSALCNSAWLYLGSGNLTRPGLCNRASANGGNLEAGVVFAPQALRWEPERGLDVGKVVTNLLPIQWTTDLSGPDAVLKAGDDIVERGIEFIAAPVAWLLWYETLDMCCLRVPDGAEISFDVLGSDGVSCQTGAPGQFLWADARPREVQLRWQTHEGSHQSLVPVLDKWGRFAATELPKIDIEQAWWLLANFPMLPDDEDLPLNDDQNVFVASGRESAASAPAATYPIREMMRLIENVATKQTAVRQVDWSVWCVRLEQVLVQASDSLTLKVFLESGINPLSPLWEAPFRPAFAESNDTPEGQRYEAALHMVEHEWNVMSLKKIGEM